MVKFNPELNLNTVLTTLAIAVMCYVGKVAIGAKDDILKLSVQQGYILKSIENVMPRAEIELKLESIKMDIQAVKAQHQAIDLEIMKLKRQAYPQKPN